MRGRICPLFAVFTLALTSPAIARDFCVPDADCWRLGHYFYAGDAYCHRYYTGSTQFFGVRGSLAGISTDDIGQLAFDAYSTWFNTGNLPVYEEYAGFDTSGSNSRLAVIDNNLFSSNWGDAVNGPLAVTQSQFNPDGVIHYNRTYIRGDNPSFDWHIDCRSIDCVPYADYDLLGLLTHELGHWWHLGDVGPPSSITACDSVTMWFQSVDSDISARTLADGDRTGLLLLYSTLVSVGHSFAAFPGPAADTLRWEESDPFSFHIYSIGVSDTCWGPHMQLVSITGGDPAYTPDGRFYTYVVATPYKRGYSYELTADGVKTRTSSQHQTGIAVAPPSQPQDLTATVVPVGNAPGVRLQWTPSSGDVTGYYVLRHWLHMSSCFVSFQAPWDILGPTTSSTFVDSLPYTGDSLFYRVRAINPTAGSPPSLEAGVDLGSVLAVAADLSLKTPGIRSVAPNPSRGEMSVTYATPRAGRVRLMLYDIAGRRVSLLADETELAGMHNIHWSNTQATAPIAGMCFLRLTIDGEPIGQRRVALIR